MLLIFFFLTNCEKEEIFINYDTTDLIDRDFYSTDTSWIAYYDENRERKVWNDTVKYFFQNSNQLLVKSQLILFGNPPFHLLKPNTIVYRHSVLYYTYMSRLMNYTIENESLIKFTSEEINYPLDETFIKSHPEMSIKIWENGTMKILEFDDFYLKAQLNKTSFSTQKDTTITVILKPLNE